MVATPIGTFNCRNFRRYRISIVRLGPKLSVKLILGHLDLESWAVLPAHLRHFLLPLDRNRCPQFRSGTLTWLPVRISGSPASLVKATEIRRGRQRH